jgi:protein-disulfide isomerase
MGSKDAPLTMVEFTDFQCPYCRQFYASTFAELKKNYIDTGKMRFYSRDMPLDFHPNAMRAAEAGRCAAEQGKFWPMRDLMAANPDKLDLENLVTDAGSLKLNVQTFRACVESDKDKNAVQTDVMEALKIGADGTPAFVVGKSTPDGVDGEVIVGAVPYGTFDAKLKESEAK